LRGLAAIIVLIAHSILHPLKIPNTDVQRFASLGVLMFFVISGFIMVFISGEKSFAPGDFIKRRLIRIVPLYWIATFAVAAIAIVAPNALKTSVFTTSHFLLSLLFIPHYAPQGGLSPLLKLGWTLNFEMFFYFCFAGLAFLNAGARVLVLTVAFIALAIIGQVFAFENALLRFYTGYILLAFCIGTWIGLATVKGWTIKGSMPLIALCILLMIAFFAAGFLIDRGTRGAVIVTYCLTLGASCLLVLGIGLEHRLPHMRLPMLLGDASYSIYLVHMYVVAVIMAISHKILPDLPTALRVLITILIAGGAGVCVHLMVEKPVLRLLQPRRPRHVEEPAHIPVEANGTAPAFDLPDGSATVSSKA
jgi:exopolysaccharide production protein ExoZ